MSAATLQPHPLALAMPEMLRDEYVELVADIKAHGLREPLTLYQGQLLDGRHRALACYALGIEPATKEFTGTTAEAKAYVLSKNVHRRHLSREQKQQIIDAELKRDPSQSDRMIARTAKTSHHKVAKARTKAEESGQIAHFSKRTDPRTGKQSQPAHIRRVPKDSSVITNRGHVMPGPVQTVHSTIVPRTVDADYLVSLVVQQVRTFQAQLPVDDRARFVQSVMAAISMLLH